MTRRGRMDVGGQTECGVDALQGGGSGPATDTLGGREGDLEEGTRAAGGRGHVGGVLLP